MSELIKKYGYCTIPKGILLYRKGDNNNLNSCIYLSLQSFASSSLPQNIDIQIWKTKKDFQLLFMISEINEVSNPFSSITEIYINHISNEITSLSDLDIKLDLENRNKIIAFLQNDNILGWFSSIEDTKSKLEICLFPKDFSTISEYVELLTEIPQSHPNALEFISLNPSKEFLNKSQLTIENSKSDFIKYSQMINFWISEYEKQGMAREDAINELSTIRTKLNI